MSSERIRHATLKEAVAAVMLEVDYVKKDAAASLNYSILTESALLSECRGPMVRHGILVFPIETKVVANGDFVTAKGSRMGTAVLVRTFRVQHVDSEDYFDVQTAGEAMDSGSNAAQKAMTLSKKYAIRELLMLQCGDDEAVVHANREAENFDWFRRACGAILACKSQGELDERTARVLESKTADWQDEQLEDLKKLSARRSAELTVEAAKPQRKHQEAL